jgi:hypothetical protein
VTTNQNTKPCQHTTDTQRPVPVTQCLTETSITSSTSDQPGNTGIAFCSCETVCGNASLPLGTTSRSGDRPGRIEKCVVLEECSAAHRWGMQHAQTVLCWSQKVLQQVPVTSGSGCDSSVVFFVTAVWPDDSDHTAHRTPWRKEDKARAHHKSFLTPMAKVLPDCTTRKLRMVFNRHYSFILYM